MGHLNDRAAVEDAVQNDSSLIGHPFTETLGVLLLAARRAVCDRVVAAIPDRELDVFASNVAQITVDRFLCRRDTKVRVIFHCQFGQIVDSRPEFGISRPGCDFTFLPVEPVREGRLFGINQRFQLLRPHLAKRRLHATVKPEADEQCQQHRAGNQHSSKSIVPWDESLRFRLSPPQEIRFLWICGEIRKSCGFRDGGLCEQRSLSVVAEQRKNFGADFRIVAGIFQKLTLLTYRTLQRLHKQLLDLSVRLRIHESSSLN